MKWLQVDDMPITFSNLYTISILDQAVLSTSSFLWISINFNGLYFNDQNLSIISLFYYLMKKCFKHNIKFKDFLKS